MLIFYILDLSSIFIFIFVRSPHFEISENVM